MSEYKSHCEPAEISATSRCAIQVKNNYYTVEASMKKTVKDKEGLDTEKEYQMLFEELNSVTDAQCLDIIDTFKK